MRGAPVLLLLSACAVRAAGAQSVVDVNVAPLAGGGSAYGEIATGPSAQGSRSGQCVLRLEAKQLRKSSSGCFLDSRFHKSSGTLVYPCGGSGDAAADFEDDHYTGKMADGHLTLERTTELDWEDGCTWGTRAAIEGTLSVGDAATAHQRLGWTYSDHVVKGSGCSGLCRATGTLETGPDDPSAPTQISVPED